MTRNDEICLEFGMPEHGWIPTKFRYNDFDLNLDISDVPIDPMIQLCDSLIQILKGISIPERIIWHLEPYCYYLQLEKSEKIFKATILESNDFDSKVKITKEISGSFESIILPLYRGLKKFNSYSFQPTDWEKINTERIDKLTDLIKKEKRT